MQEWAEVVQRLHGQEQHIWSLISTLQTMSGWKPPHFPQPTPDLVCVQLISPGLRTNRPFDLMRAVQYPGRQN